MQVITLKLLDYLNIKYADNYIFTAEIHNLQGSVMLFLFSDL